MLSTRLLQFSIGLDGSSSLQRQLHSQIRQLILSGELKAGERLPSSRSLASDLSVARITVTEAYDQLTAEGYLETKTGAGTFVTDYVPDHLGTVQAGAASTPTNTMPEKRAPLSSGMPALDAFPKDKWARSAGRVARKLNLIQMYHADPMGYQPLRAEIAEHLRLARNVVCNPEQVMIVSGLQQGLFVLANSILDDESAIILEDPGYDGLLAAARASGKTIKFTGVDDDGALPPGKDQGLLTVSPSRQYPLGLTMPHGRRLELLAWARANDSFILEDDYDSEFRYLGRPLNSLQGIAGGERVIYGGTFSKAIFPALRLGYLVLPEPLVESVVKFREAIDSHPTITNQLLLHDFMASGEFHRHVRRLRKIHLERKEKFDEAAHSHLRNWLSFLPSDAGLHCTAWLTDAALALKLKDHEVAKVAQACGIGAVSISRCYQFAPPKQGLLMGFANLLPSEIEPAIQRLAAYFHKETGFSS